MFGKLTMRGQQASIAWGYRQAATLGTWTVRKDVDEKTQRAVWTLTARLGTQVDRFQLRQRPLLFSAPRKGGFWVWPVRTLHVGETTLLADLGPPEY